MRNLGLLRGILTRFLQKGISLGEDALVLIDPFSSNSALTSVMWLIWGLLVLGLLGRTEGILMLSSKNGLTGFSPTLGGMLLTWRQELLTSLGVYPTIAQFFLRPIPSMVIFFPDPSNFKAFGYRICLFLVLCRKLGVRLGLSKSPLRTSLRKRWIGISIILEIFLARKRESWPV